MRRFSYQPNWNAISALASVVAMLISVVALYTSMKTTEPDIKILRISTTEISFHNCKSELSEENDPKYGLLMQVEAVVEFRNEGGSSISLERVDYENDLWADQVLPVFEFNDGEVEERSERFELPIRMEAHESRRWRVRKTGLLWRPLDTPANLEPFANELREQLNVGQWRFEFGTVIFKENSSSIVDDFSTSGAEETPCNALLEQRMALPWMTR